MLFKREKCIKEVVLVCNDETKEEFDGCKLYNMGLKDYAKPKMCNFGVSKVSSDVVAILDSDRVLPVGYFDKIARTIRKGQAFSCSRLAQLTRSHTDEEIDSGDLEFEIEVKSRGWEIRRKNLFSGNTTFVKSDYLMVGGMDENFVGYGFADNDMTYNFFKNGVDFIWTEGEEIHLFHEKETLERGQLVDFEKYRQTSQKNLNRFLRKWKLKDLAIHYKHMV